MGGLEATGYFLFGGMLMWPEELSTQIRLGTSKSVGSILIFGTYSSV